MGTFWLLAAEAHSSGEGGFGLNLNILDTNIINLAILIGVLFYYGRKIVSKTLSERRSRIEEAIRTAESRSKEAASALADQQQKLAQAQAEAERIRKASEESAKTVKASIAEQTEADIERVKATAVQELNSEQERAIAQLRQRVAELALERVESQLKETMDSSAQTQLIDRAIAQLGGS
ncbi:F0F1 ATP synthase subunit B [Lusitaniella coriacea]|uniref:F0F1 ATP synthase subunit B n=1 Tax=Lusitaniella coriacea TaxID=1983105 RepID=UPI003CF377FC